MNINQLLLNVRNVSFADAIRQTEILTEDDKKKYQQKGYITVMTDAEFRKMFTGVNPKYIYHTPSISMGCFYFNEETFAVCPFHIEFYQAGIPGYTPEGAYKAFAQREQDVAKGKYFGSVMTLADGMRLEYFSRLIAKKGKDIPDLYELFFSVYLESDYGFRHLSPDALQTVLNSKTENDKQKTAKLLMDLPDTITVYRGGNTASTPYNQAYSWTLSLNIAYLFACMHGEGPGYIVEGRVNKEDILDLFLDDKDEDEVLVAPENVRIIRETTLHGMGYLNETLPEIIPTYHHYRDAMDDLEFVQESSVHGKDHEARVLLLSQLIAHEMDLPVYERNILATAAIYHDTQRTHDWEEVDHGKNAAEYYLSDSEKPNGLVAFLCEYHCLPDEEGYAEIRNNRWLSRRSSQAKRLLQIFKDADGLDRLRLGGGIRELDINQLRLDFSKELVLVAKICLEQIKI